MASSKIQFKDITSYSIGDKDRTPRTFEAHVGGLRLVVTRHIQYPDQWVLSCDPFFALCIKDCPVAEAQRKAVVLLRADLTATLDELS